MRFYNFCFKFDFGNRVDEIMIYSCCNVLINTCQFKYDLHHAMAKHNIKKILYFLILYETKQVQNRQQLLPPSVECNLLIVFNLSVFQILLSQPLVAYMSNLEWCFSIFLHVTIQWHHKFLTISQKDRHLLLCYIAYTVKKL